MQLAPLVATSEALTATSSRLAKRRLLAALLRDLTLDELPVALGLLRGDPRQGRVGVGWNTLRAVEVAMAAGPTLTLHDVDATFDALATTAGSGSQTRRAALLRSMMERATAGEATFLWRVFAGEVRHGALDGVLTDAVAEAEGVSVELVRRAAMFSGDLGIAAVVARAGGADALAAVGLRVLQAVQPMLASTATDVAGAMAGAACSVEWKLDGARVQAHRRDGVVRLFTRNLNDITARLPDVVARVAALPGTTLVLDGEVLGVGDDGRPDAFQDTMSSFGADAAGRSLRVWFFDVLHADGEDLVDVPLSVRRAVLERVVGPLAVPALATADVAAADAFAAAALHAGHEGVVVKRLDSLYEAGRRGASWRKVKPVHTFDLVVLGAEWGHGRRTGRLSNLHLGARDERDGSFVMVGKTFKGLTDELLAWQTERFEALAVERAPGVVMVRPELVVEVALDGVQRSRRYPGGLALRFARVRRYRPDKDPAEADTLAALRQLLARAVPSDGEASC